jgi:hypothetical protein
MKRKNADERAGARNVQRRDTGSLQSSPHPARISLRIPRSSLDHAALKGIFFAYLGVSAVKMQKKMERIGFE